MDRAKPGKFEEFYKLILHIHRIANMEVMIGYADVHGDLLPINNDDNFCKAVSTAHPLLRIFIQRQGRPTQPAPVWYRCNNNDLTPMKFPLGKFTLSTFVFLYGNWKPFCLLGVCVCFLSSYWLDQPESVSVCLPKSGVLSRGSARGQMITCTRGPVAPATP